MSSQNNAQQLPDIVRSIESRVGQLLEDHKRLTKLNHELQMQRDKLLCAKQEMQQQIAQLEKDLALSQLKSGLEGGSKNNQRARAYINRLMREVDNCITLLSSPGADLKE